MRVNIGLAEALELTLANIAPMGPETLPLEHLVERIVSHDVVSTVDSPSVDASLKDGYAVHSEDLVQAGEAEHVVLELAGSVAAGATTSLHLARGQAMRVTTGAPLPLGADAVLAEEFAMPSGKVLVCRNTAEPGRNVLKRGADIRAGQIVAHASDHITPSLVGLFATAGIDRVQVFRSPVVCVIATGDEVVAPGKPLPEGRLYASNVTEICAWFSKHRIPTRVRFTGDSEAETVAVIEQEIEHADAFVSSGGIWGSERDLMLKVLERLDWHGVYHRVRMGPGKAVAFGLLRSKPFFCLPGGPPSNEMAFLQIALPGALRMQGHNAAAFPKIAALLVAPVRGVGHWTQFVHAKLNKVGGRLVVVPLQQKSRLQTMAEKNALICIPEGCEALDQGTTVDVQVLDGQVLHG